MQLKDYEKVESSNIDFKEKVEWSKPKSWLRIPFCQKMGFLYVTFLDKFLNNILLNKYLK